MRVLLADIGFGTTDILVYDSSLALENCPKLVVPSRTQQVAGAIREATRQGLPVAMSGVTMGGGPSGRALREHLAAGLPFFADSGAASTFHDDIGRVASWGVTIAADPLAAAPAGSVPLTSADLDIPALKQALRGLGVDPGLDGAAIAVQDHGYSPGASNRRHRFRLWSELLAGGGSLGSLAWRAGEIPAPYTRMRAVAELLAADFEHVVLMDTGPAALWGARLAAPDRERLLVVNVGNGHTLAALMLDHHINGLVEHHTGLLDRDGLETMLRRFAAGRLTNDEVFDDGGHGCLPPLRPARIEELLPAAVTGPRRALMAGGGLELDFVAPFGDMMLTGCFGLLEAYRSLI